MAINDLIDKLTNRFTDTIIVKEENELQKQIDALSELLNKYPDNDELLKKKRICELGLLGEKEIEFELKNANIGMYVLHDVNIEYEDLKAQIDYIIITPAKLYFVECKNLIGNITVDNKGNFIREYQYGKKKVKEGIYSPATQAQRHVEIFKKIWKSKNTGIIDKTIRARYLDNWYVPLVVFANSKNIINDRYAPKDIKSMIIKSDRLVDYLKKDVSNTERDLLSNKKQMEASARNIIDNYSIYISKDYEKEFEKSLSIKSKNESKENNISNALNIRKRLIEFRTQKSKAKNIPAYYIFNNDELDKLLVAMPKNRQELINSNILSDVKIKMHGDEILKILIDSH